MSATENNPPPPPSPEARPPDPAPPRPAPRGGRVSSGLALILSIVALLGTGFVWYTLIYERPELTQLDLPSTIADLERTAAELQAEQDETDDRLRALTETQNTLRTALDNLQAELGRNQTQWTVNEAEQLLLIANRRLQLARDVSSALSALRAADRQLELLASPNLLPVRREIAQEIGQLESLERADITGMALRLGSLAGRIDQLPLAPQLQMQSEQVAIADDEGTSAQGIWRDLLSLVRIRRHDTAQRPLLPPEQQYFARENLRLMLYGAQHALLQGNSATFQQNLNTAARWLNDYYDAGSAAVETAQQELDKLQATAVMSELPDISASLEMLRKISGRQRGS